MSSSSSSSLSGAVKRPYSEITPDPMGVSEHFQHEYNEAIKRASKKVKLIAVTEVNKKSIVAWEACTMKKAQIPGNRIGKWLPDVLRTEILQYMPTQYEQLPTFHASLAQQNTKIAEDRDFRLIKKKMMEYIEQRSIDGFDHAIVKPIDIENWADEVLTFGSRWIYAIEKYMETEGYDVVAVKKENPNKKDSEYKKMSDQEKKQVQWDKRVYKIDWAV